MLPPGVEPPKMWGPLILCSLGKAGIREVLLCPLTFLGDTPLKALSFPNGDLNDQQGSIKTESEPQAATQIFFKILCLKKESKRIFKMIF